MVENLREDMIKSTKDQLESQNETVLLVMEILK